MYNIKVLKELKFPKLTLMNNCYFDPNDLFIKIFKTDHALY